MKKAPAGKAGAGRSEMELGDAVVMMEEVLTNWDKFGVPDIPLLIPKDEPERSAYKAFWLECFKTVHQAAKNLAEKADRTEEGSDRAWPTA